MRLRPFGRKPKGVELSLVRLCEDGFCAVAGESHYQDALRRTRPICTETFEDRPAFTAALVPEPHNEYDTNAVAVYSPEGKLGYMPRDMARSYRPVFVEVIRRGFEGGACGAHLTGGEPGKEFFGVVLRLADPETCLEELAADPEPERHRSRR